MATSWQIGTSYHNRYSPLVMTTNSQYGNWFPDGGRGSIGRTMPATRRTLGAVSGDKRTALTPVDIQQVVNATAVDPRDKFTAFMAKSGSARLAATQDGDGSPLTVAESVQQTRRSANTPGNSPEPGTVAEYQSATIASLSAQNRDNASKLDTRDSRFSSKPPGVVDVRPYVQQQQQQTGSATREVRVPFSRSQPTPVNATGASGEPNAASRELAPRAMPTLERSQTFHGRPTTPFELATMRKNDVMPDSYQWRSPQSDATPPGGTDTPTYVLASERGRHAGNYKTAAAPAGNRAMYWLYGSRGRPGPVVANDYLFSRDALDSQYGDRQGPKPPGRPFDNRPTTGPLDSPSRTADARQAAAAAASGQPMTVNSWTALRSPDTPYVSTVTVNSPRSADVVGRASRASGDVTSRAIASSRPAGAAEKRSILKRTSGYDVGTYRVSGSVHLFGDPRLPPLSATSRTPSGRKRVTFNL